MAQEKIWKLLENIKSGDLTPTVFRQKLGNILENEAGPGEILGQKHNDGSTIFDKILELPSCDSNTTLKIVLEYLTEEDAMTIAKLTNVSSRSALHLAVEDQNLDFIKAILAKVAERKIFFDLLSFQNAEATHNTQCLLHFAVKSEYHPFLESVVDHSLKTPSQAVDNEETDDDRFCDTDDEDLSYTDNAEPNYTVPRFQANEEGYNAFHAAAEGRCPKYLSSLLKLIPNDNGKFEVLKRKTKAGSTPLHIAFEKGNNSIPQAIKKEIGVDRFVELLEMEDGELLTPVNIAVKYGQDGIIKFLSELLTKESNDITQLLSGGPVTPFHSAAISGSCLKELLSLLPADPQKQKEVVLKTNQKKQSVLHLACEHGKLEFLKNLETTVQEFGFFTKLLLAADNDGNTPLHHAVKNRWNDIVSHVLGQLGNRNRTVWKLLLKANKESETVHDIHVKKAGTQSSVQKKLFAAIKEDLDENLRQFQEIGDICAKSEEAFKESDKRYCESKANKEKKEEELGSSSNVTHDESKAALEAFELSRQRLSQDKDDRLKNWKQYQKDLKNKAAINSKQQALAKNLELINFIVHKRAGMEDSIITDLLKLMHSPIESIGLLILLASSGHGDYFIQHKQQVVELLTRPLNGRDNALVIWNQLKKLVASDPSGKKLDRESCQQLLQRATSDLAEQRAHQYILKWTDVHGNTLAHIAARERDDESLQRLIEWQVTSHPNNNDSVLHFKNKSDQTPKDVQLGSGNFQEDFWMKLSSKLDRYPGLLETQPKVLIFYQSEKRKGTNREVADLKKFANTFGTEAEVCSDNTAKEVKDKIKAGQSEKCLIVAILAHGRSGQVQMKDEPIEIKEIVKAMERRQGNNPMVLILEACQTERPAVSNDQEQLSDVLDIDTASNIEKKLQQPSLKETLQKALSRHNRPANVKIAACPPLEEVRSDNLVLRSTFAVGRIAHGLSKASYLTPDEASVSEEAPVSEKACVSKKACVSEEVLSQMKKESDDAITMLGQAFHFLKHRQVETGCTPDEYPEEFDVFIPSGNAFDYVPAHFLCLSATVNASVATRGLLTGLVCKKLNEMFHSQQGTRQSQSEAETHPVEIDIQRLFEYVLAAVYVETHIGQVSIIARTLLKRLCLNAVNECPVPEDTDDVHHDDDDEEEEAINETASHDIQ